MTKIQKKKNLSPPRFDCKEEGGKMNITNSPDVDAEKGKNVLRKATGSEDVIIAELLVSQVYNAYNIVGQDKNKAVNTCLALMQDIGPQNATQALLATQMIATHNLAMDVLRRAGLNNQTFAGVDANINRANKLLKAFVAQSEAMQKLQGKSGRQKMTVEHVHVNEGGQAIIGHVVNRGRGRVKDER